MRQQALSQQQTAGQPGKALTLMGCRMHWKAAAEVVPAAPPCASPEKVTRLYWSVFLFTGP
jgi:hypothetical protein